MAFVKLPIVRGFTEIYPLYCLCLQHGAVIAGGYARYCCSPIGNPAKPGDCDVFPKTEEANTAIVEQLKAWGFEVKYDNDMAVSLRPNAESKDKLAGYPEIQVIKPMVEGSIVTTGTTEEILSNFDFSITRAAIVSERECLVDEHFAEDEKDKLLRLLNIHCPISSMLRCCKYTNKGYRIRAGEALKLFIDWEGRDESYRATIVAAFEKAGTESGLTKQELKDLYKLMRVD